MIEQLTTPSVANHLILDLRGAKGLADPAFLERVLVNAAVKAGATVLNCYFHHFGEGLGVTGVVSLKESHVSIHSWPELDYAAVDIFMCGSCDIDACKSYIEEALQASSSTYQVLPRGQLANFALLERGKA